MQRRTHTGGSRFFNGRRRGTPSVATSGPPTEAGAVGEVDDELTLTTQIGDDGAVTVSVVGEVDGCTAPMLRSLLDTQLERQPSELVLDLRGVRFLGSAGLAVLVGTQTSADARDIALRLIATTRPVTRPLEVTGLIDLFSVSGDAIDDPATGRYASGRPQLSAVHVPRPGDCPDFR
jgi:anti-sigma B factor antagonist